MYYNFVLEFFIDVINFRVITLLLKYIAITQAGAACPPARMETVIIKLIE